MVDTLELPDFLDRKKNGVVPEPLPAWAKRAKAASKLIMPKQRLTKEERENSVRIYLNNPIEHTALASGWNTVIVVKSGTKHVKIRLASKDRCYVLDRSLWDKLEKKDLL